MFVGAITDNFDERIEQKIFHAEIVADNERVKRKPVNYKKYPSSRRGRTGTDQKWSDTMSLVDGGEIVIHLIVDKLSSQSLHKS